jgi:hypothetical protein
MFLNTGLGEEIYRTWSDDQRREEIVRLVNGYRAGLPVGILCKMAEAIAGSQKSARGFLLELLTDEERQAAVARETGGMQQMVSSFLL